MNVHILAKVLYTVFAVTFMVTAMSYSFVWSLPLGSTTSNWTILVCLVSLTLCVKAFTSIVRLVNLLEAKGESL